ncbi:J domain-containing protein [Gloeocapsa sp. PCC 73106]|uniref:J domain-containing protein n=1 Tax=Gloeocapsa sp. PCC 73106 TaxID=102232 RepID=UPI0002ACB0A6|nr:DnaJ domain-containing protein [Gloeocapsa sp. PCC 73106]ELR97176.1 DnaJ-class molecular chaperone with C-terminal Zn finger domain [Gloeocapsa sp. PCC 73106]
MTEENHYQILGISQQASQTQIKLAYRSLVKQFHPDSQTTEANHDKIVSINAAYEVLGDPQKRRTYDRQLLRSNPPGIREVTVSRDVYAQREKRAVQVQQEYARHRANERQAELQFERWLQQVYKPINQWLSLILEPLDQQIEALAGDPFDEELMRDFQRYLSISRQYLIKARLCLHHQPNPSKLARTAANLYYCLNQVGDGLDELDIFTQTYCERYLHNGQELFKIARGLQLEANSVVANWL